MRSAIICTVSLLGAAAAQTPEGWYPPANKTLGVSYGDMVVTPDKTVSADNVTSQPAVYPLGGHSTGDDAQSYMIIMLDLNIPDSDVATAEGYGSLVPGLAVNTTTRLHWWGGNYTLDAAGGAYVNSSDSLAQYTAPRPRDELYHSYIFYLFSQPASYVPPVAALEGEYYDQTSDARMNFSLAPVIDAVGLPLAANYFIANDDS